MNFLLLIMIKKIEELAQPFYYRFKHSPTFQLKHFSVDCMKFEPFSYSHSCIDKHPIHDGSQLSKERNSPVSEEKNYFLEMQIVATLIGKLNICICMYWFYDAYNCYCLVRQVSDSLLLVSMCSVHAVFSI